VDIVTSTKVPMIQPADVFGLPQGQAFALLEGNRRFKLRIPLPARGADPFIPESIRQVALDMKARYRTSEQWARETDWLGNQPIGLAGAGVIDTTLAMVGADLDDPAADASPTRTERSMVEVAQSINAAGVLE
jgi:hypothetical protein